MTTGDGDPSSKSDADTFLRAVAAAPDRAVESTPARIAHFRIVGKLGHGGMGVVYRAEDETLRRTVALKLLPGGTRATRRRRQRFLREARSAAAIAHPNVAVVHQVGEADGRVYIAMELVEGESLRATPRPSAARRRHRRATSRSRSRGGWRRRTRRGSCTAI